MERMATVSTEFQWWIVFMDLATNYIASVNSISFSYLRLHFFLKWWIFWNLLQFLNETFADFEGLIPHRFFRVRQ